MSEEELRERIDALERALDAAIIYLNKSPRTPDHTIESIFVLLDALEKAKCKDMEHLDKQKIQPRSRHMNSKSGTCANKGSQIKKLAKH